MNHLTTLNPIALEQLQEPSELRNLESFFSSLPSDPLSQKKLWIKPTASHLEEISSKILMEASFQKQGKRTRIWKSRYYILTNEFLAYKEKGQAKIIKKVMLFERVKMDIVKIEQKGIPEKYGLRFTKNHFKTTLYTSDLKIYESFKAELEIRCVLHSFKEKYHIEKLIGKGTFGKVYLIKRISDNQKFAAKMFFKDTVLKQKKGKESLLNEIAILKSLDHPGIMKLIEVHETMLSIFLVMELLEGGELFQLLQEKRNYSENDCDIMLRRIIDSLMYMHDKGFMHRDLKPENLVLRSKDMEYDIVIADFGLAQDLSKPYLHLRCGTPGYVAPEILNYQPNAPLYDAKCDIFSLGCIFYHIIVGKNPFRSKYPKETLHLNRECIISFDNPRIKGLSSNAQDLMKKMLEKDPIKRPSLQECLEHEFFLQSNRLTSPIVFSYLRLTLTPRNSRDKSKELKEFKTSQDYDETMSFHFGRTNLIKGLVDTWNESSAALDKNTDLPGIERTQVSRSTFLRQARKQESVSLSPYKNSSRLQDFIFRNHVKSNYEEGSGHSSIHSEDLGNLNTEENEKENLQRRSDFVGKIKNLTNNGTIPNPFNDLDRINKQNNLNLRISCISFTSNEQTLNSPSKDRKTTQ